MLVVRGGEHHHGPGRHALDHLEAVEPGHVDVEEEDVHRLSADLLQRLLGIGGLADDLDPAGRREHPGQPLERQRLVVDEKRAEEGGRRHRVRTPAAGPRR